MDEQMHDILSEQAEETRRLRVKIRQLEAELKDLQQALADATIKRVRNGW